MLIRASGNVQRERIKTSHSYTFNGWKFVRRWLTTFPRIFESNLNPTSVTQWHVRLWHENELYLDSQTLLLSSTKHNAQKMWKKNYKENPTWDWFDPFWKSFPRLPLSPSPAEGIKVHELDGQFNSFRQAFNQRCHSTLTQIICRTFLLCFLCVPHFVGGFLIRWWNWIRFVLEGGWARWRMSKQ